MGKRQKETSDEMETKIDRFQVLHRELNDTWLDHKEEAASTRRTYRINYRQASRYSHWLIDRQTDKQTDT